MTADAQRELTLGPEETAKIKGIVTRHRDAVVKALAEGWEVG
jgi:hypothetical protein